MCVYFMTGTPEGMESGFMEKPGIELATPSLQDIGLSPTPRWLLEHLHKKHQHTQKQTLLMTIINTSFIKLLQADSA